MQEASLLEKICSEECFFKDLESMSEMNPRFEQGKFLCVRLDGIGLSKKYLKDNLSNGKFDNLVRDTVVETYQILKKRSKTNAQNQFLCVFSASDEVSFIYNAYPNYFENRLYKTVTTTASIFSSVFTKKGKRSNISGAFDGRPVIFDSAEQVCDYLLFRYGVYIRNTSAKLLRLDGRVEDLYEHDNLNNFEYLSSTIKKLELTEKQIHIPKHPRLYVPMPNGDLEECKFESTVNFRETSKAKIYSYNEWLRVTNA